MRLSQTAWPLPGTPMSDGTSSTPGTPSYAPQKVEKTPIASSSVSPKRRVASCASKRSSKSLQDHKAGSEGGGEGGGGEGGGEGGGDGGGGEGGGGLRTFRGSNYHENTVTSLALLPDGLRFVIGSDDHTARIFFHGLAPQ